jgi:calcium-dependent protein kinase
VYEDPLNIMEHCKGGEYYDRISKKVRMTEVDAALVLFKIFHAMSHVHALGYFHRDLKPENFLYETDKPNSEIKVADFGSQSTSVMASLSSLWSDASLPRP